MKIALYGYGNLARGIEAAVAQNPDITLAGVFTRRDPASVHTATGAPLYAASELDAHGGSFDVLILCGGSATDLPEMTPALAKRFHVLDSFDTHARIPEHFARVDAAAREGGHIALISGGWDPGMFSLSRLYGSVILPEGKDYTFWGRGVSQGHSDAVRRIPGVKDARAYTVPLPEALNDVRRGSMPELTARQKHRREVYIVAEDGADRAAIQRAVVTMPNYFDEYDTAVTFLSAEEMAREHAALPHGGFVLRTGKTGLGREHRHTVEYRLTLDSNPEFTAGVLVALARAVGRMAGRGETGCRTMFDVVPADLSPLSGAQLRARLL